MLKALQDDIIYQRVLYKIDFSNPFWISPKPYSCDICYFKRNKRNGLKKACKELLQAKETAYSRNLGNEKAQVKKKR